MDRLADIMPANIRRIVYAVLALVVPTVTVLIAVLKDGWQWDDLVLVLTSVVAAAGFGMAKANTS